MARSRTERKTKAAEEVETLWSFIASVFNVLVLLIIWGLIWMGGANILGDKLGFWNLPQATWIGVQVVWAVLAIPATLCVLFAFFLFKEWAENVEL